MKWTVRTRLVGLSLMGLALLFAVAATAGWSLRQAAVSGRVMRHHVQAVRDHLEMDMMHDALRADVLAVVAAKDAPSRDEAVATLRQHVARLERYAARSPASALDLQTRAVTGEIREEFRRFAESSLRIAERAEAGDHASLERELPVFLAQWARLEPLAEGVSDRLEAGSSTAAAAMDRAAEAGTQWTLAIAALAILASLFAAHRVRQSILLPLDESVRVMDAVAGGDLDARVSPGRDDELGKLGDAVNRGLESVGAALSRIAENAVAVGNASEELASVSNELQSSAKQTSEQTALASGAS